MIIERSLSRIGGDATLGVQPPDRLHVRLETQLVAFII
jgi:hypothetical protein